MGSLNKLILLFFIALAFSFKVGAQVEFVPIPSPMPPSSSLNSRLQSDTVVIDLNEGPFFDDFSSSENHPDSSLWLASGNITLSEDVGIQPPSINVAALDGITATGSPYSPGVTIVDSVDALTSQFIDMTTISPSEWPGIYISFFWQAEGRAELPDSRDSLVLRFKDANNQWVNVWSVTGGRQLRSNRFNIEIFPISAFSSDQNPMFHDSFQFSFQAYGNPSSAVDFWLIDYVQLGADRRLDDTSFFDQSWTSLPSSILGNYTAIPLEHVQENPFDSLWSSTLGYANLRLLPLGLFPASITAVVRNAVTEVPVDTLNFPDNEDFPNSDRVEASPNNYVFLDHVSNPARTDFVNSYLSSVQDSSVILESFFQITSANNLVTTNDTVSSRLTFDDFYAYDDGTGEDAIRLFQASGQLAQRYVVRSADVLSAIEAYFPPITATSSGTLRLRVWASDRGVPGNILYEDPVDRTANQIAASRLNEFTTFEIDEINVQDTVWIGYVQSSVDLIGIAYDRNNDQKSEIRFNVGGEWEQLDENDEVDPPGNLMIRPVFRNSILTATKPVLTEEKWLVYPNPSTGVFRINGRFDRYEVHNIAGQLVLSSSSPVFDLSSQHKGLYILRIFRGNTSESRRIILR
jgi:hypothetical protein